MIKADRYELDQETDRCRPTGSYVNRLTTDAPFPLGLDLTEADRL